MIERDRIAGKIALDSPGANASNGPQQRVDTRQSPECCVVGQSQHIWEIFEDVALRGASVFHERYKIVGRRTAARRVLQLHQLTIQMHQITQQLVRGVRCWRVGRGVKPGGDADAESGHNQSDGHPGELASVVRECHHPSAALADATTESAIALAPPNA